MGKSGKINRDEPTDVGWIEKLPGCVELFQQAGWLEFFKRINGYNTEVSCKFAQCFKDDMVTFDTLKFRLTVELIAEATGVKNEGELWFKKLPFTFDPQRYLFPNVTQTGVRASLFKISGRNGLNQTEFCRVTLLARAGMLMYLSITSDFCNIWWGCLEDEPSIFPIEELTKNG